MGACASKRAAEFAEAPAKPPASPPPPPPPPPPAGSLSPSASSRSDDAEDAAGGDSGGAPVAALLAELPHLAGSDVPRHVARSLCRAGAAVTQDDGTYRAPAVELMRIYGQPACAPGGAPLLSGDALTGLLESFVRPAMADGAAAGVRDCTPAEAAGAVCALRAQLNELAADPALGITVDDLEAWLEQLDAAAAREEEEEEEEAATEDGVRRRRLEGGANEPAPHGAAAATGAT